MTESRENFIRLYKNHKNGKIGWWQGWTKDDTVYIEFASSLNDSSQMKMEHIKEGKQGRTVPEQAAFRLRSRAKSKIDGGYVATITEAQAGPTDANGQVKPMLAQSIKGYKPELVPDRSFVQPKYNGHRALLIANAGTIAPLSRNGKTIPAAGHITNGMQLDDGMIIDGEIYKHGWPLQRIASAAKKLQADSAELRFVAYDLVAEQRFSIRHEQLTQLHKDGCLGSHCQLAPTKRLDEIDSLKDLLERVRSKGYEGLIVRIDEKPYETGRRTNQLLKVKVFLDGEFKIIDILKSKDGWAIFVCEIETGGTFKVSAPGTMADKYKFLNDPDYWINKYVTVEYSELTVDGVPFHASATQIRIDL